MRTSLLRTAALSAVALGVVTGLPSQAASPYKTVAITDPAGDGNGLNGQGVVTGAPSTATPSDYSGGPGIGPIGPPVPWCADSSPSKSSLRRK